MNLRVKAGALTVLSLSLLFCGRAIAADADLLWSTFLGGSERDWGYAIATDELGNAYVTGYTWSDDFPVTSGAFDTTSSGDTDAFVVKLNPAGSAIIYATFLGGDEGDWGHGIAVDGSGSAYVGGYTGSVQFPTTFGAFDTTFNGSYDVFAAKLDPTGSVLDYATYIGGSLCEHGYAMAIDDSGSAYLTGMTYSNNFPTTAGAFDTTHNGSPDVFVVKLDPLGSALDYSTFLGGSDHDFGQSIALDGSGYAYVTGYTLSAGFPTTPGAFDTLYHGDRDVFVVKLSAAGDSLDYATLLGGTAWDEGDAIATDGSGYAYVTGYTGSDSFPITSGAYDSIYNGGGDVFVTRLDPTGALLDYSTFLGGSEQDWGHDMAIDGSGNACLTGHTYSSNFPATSGAFDVTLNGGKDVFVARLDPAGSALGYATYLGGGNWDEGGGIAIVDSGRVCLTGYTWSDDFPTTSGALDTIYNGGDDVFVTRLDMSGDQTPPEAIDDLDIDVYPEAKLTYGNVRICWSEPYDDVGVLRYVVYRRTMTNSDFDSLAGTAYVAYNDYGAAGDVDTNYVYMVKAVDGAGNRSEASNMMGEFDLFLSNGEE